MSIVPRSKAGRLAAVAGVALLLGAAAASANASKDMAPIPAPTLALMAQRGTTAAAPILIRTFKKEAELEVWKKGRDGRFVHLKTFPICRWSGQLGPKLKQGDRQAPEGFYSVGPKQMNPKSAYHLSFDTGFPNAYDKAHGATGSYLMVHGTCSSAGCFAMTDQGIEEVYALAREAFAGGQPAFQFQSYPFRMSAENVAKHRLDRNIAFWRQLKEGSDRFEATGEEPAVSVVAGRYAFGPSKDSAKEASARARVAEQTARIAALIEDGAAAVRTTYADGGQHPSFRALARVSSPSLGMISRPEALAFAGREVVVVSARSKPATQVAAAPGAALRLATAGSEALPAASGNSTMAELSVFAPVPLGSTGPMTVAAILPGSMPILPAKLTRNGLKLAARW